MKTSIPRRHNIRRAFHHRIGYSPESGPLILALFLTLGILSCGEPDVPSLPEDIERLVRGHVESLIDSNFRDLDDLTIEYLPVTESTDTIFFETYVKTSTVLRNPKHRTYQIFVNDRLSEDRPDDAAIRAILAHELFHIRDYFGKSVWQLYQLKKDYEDKRFREQYERYTDQRALELGYGPGLILYRQWLYRAIQDPAKIEDKKRTYMTPEEIRSWIQRHQNP